MSNRVIPISRAMDALSFVSWMSRLEMRVRDAAEALGRSEATIKRYRAGTVAVPAPVARLARLIERQQRSCQATDKGSRL